MPDILYYTASSIGLMCILKYGSILSIPRTFLVTRFFFFADLFKCSLCLGFWTGVAISCFVYFLTPDFNYKWFLYPLVSSVTCWIADSVIGIFKYTESYLQKKQQPPPSTGSWDS